MERALLEVLVDPIVRTPLRLEAERQGDAGRIVEGSLRGADGRSYAIRAGIPRLVVGGDHQQAQTAGTFGFKWQRRDSYESESVRASSRRWFVERYGFGTVERMQAHFASRRRILDAGCGSGWTASFWLSKAWQRGSGAAWYGAEISEAIDVAQQRLSHVPGTHFIQADLLQLPFPSGTFDTVLAEGVLHHTPSTAAALLALAEVVEPGGELLFYVYRKKGPIREFTDDHLRSILSALPPAEAWERLRPLTKLGQALAELKAELEVPEAIPELGIQAGRYDLQRFIYWHMAKLFWNPAYSFEENLHVNFDWYHPRYAHRHTEAEIRQWCGEAGLCIEHFDAQESGFTVRAGKASGGPGKGS